MIEEASFETRWRALPFVLAAFPFIGAVLLVVRWGITLPYYDQWSLVYALDGMYEGTLTWRALWAQHNAHRILFPKLIMLALARSSHWNIALELAVNVALVTGTFACIARQVYKTGRVIDRFPSAWLMPVVSLLVFSLAQWRNLIWGWQLQILLSVFAGVAGLTLLCDAPPRRLRFALACALGLVATYSFASGMSFWFAAVAGLLCLRLGHNESKTGPRLLVLVLLGGLAIAAFLYGYRIPKNHSSAALIIEKPLEYVLYVLNFLAVAVTGSRRAAPIVGLFGVAATAAMSAWLILRRRIEIKVLAPYLSMSVLAICAAMITGIGRLNHGSAQALSSRYVSASAIFWAAFFVIACLFVCSLDHKRRLRGASVLVMTALCMAISFNSAKGAFAASERSRFLEKGRAELVAGNDPKVLLRYFTDVEELKKRRELLRKHRLSIFRHSNSQ